jgi:Proto-chlorophyllide reductase 57 kD subunit
MSQIEHAIQWTPEALDSVKRAPAFLQGMVKKLAEKKAREVGCACITAELLAGWKNEAMGAMGGEAGLKEAADKIEKGKLPWTQEARERLDTVPEFMRGMIKRIAEEFARDGGHLEVNTALFARVEALGVMDDQGPESTLPWTMDALGQLAKKVEQSPEIAREFVSGMLRHDVEEQARERGLHEITPAALTEIWDAPLSQVKWSEEAWARLQTAPDFVRSGIKKAAERKARKAKVDLITSDLLTGFRNEAMMRAVMRIRSLGYRELTFDAFDTAKNKVKRLQGNTEASKRMEEIRTYVSKKGPIGNLGEELMGRFRAYLKADGTPKPPSLKTDDPPKDSHTEQG